MVGPFAAALAKRCCVRVICPDYRLAPEFPFPAGLSDGLSVMESIGSEKFMLSGDSAGGGLAASMAALAENSDETLMGLALLSPWLDLTVTAETYCTNSANDPLFSQDAAQTAALQYLQGHPATDPLASPMNGRIDRFPPTFINAGDGEVLLDDARAMAFKLQQAGVACELNIVADMQHVAVTQNLALPGALDTFEALAAFVETCLANT